MRLPKFPKSHCSWLKCSDKTRTKYFDLYYTTRDHLLSNIAYLDKLSKYYANMDGFSNDRYMRASRLKWLCEKQLRQLKKDWYRYSYCVDWS